MIRKYVESGGPSKNTAKDVASAVAECGIEVSQTSRATCKRCSQKIMKGEVGYYVSLLVFLLSWNSCWEGSYSEYFELHGVIKINYHVRHVVKVDGGGHLHLVCYMHYHIEIK